LSLPPPNAGEPPVPQEGLTTRELYEKVHAVQPSCAGCHGLIDPVGFGLEHFDVAGRYRTTERRKAIDSTGHVSGLDGKDPSFTDHRSLGTTLAASPQVADCVTGLLSAYAFGASDGASFPLPETKAQARAGTLSLLEMYARLAAAPTFTLRKGT
jgi:hypothetical protein